MDHFPESHTVSSRTASESGAPPVSGKTALIVGAGPAGLTAAFEFLRHGGVKPIVIEATREIGGLSRTVCYHGNRMDIGGHRFFSRSDRVMDWWLARMPLDPDANGAAVSYRNRSRAVDGSRSASAAGGRVMLVRPRKSRIYFQGRFFDYPISPTKDTLMKLGPMRAAGMALSYIASRLRRIHPENSLEDFLINHFGRQMYLTFFKSYTEKVWGIPCNRLSAEWGAQRIKGLSLASAIGHSLRSFAGNGKDGVAQKGAETSLIERFLYPKFGPGQLWEHVADSIRQQGGEIHLGWKVVAVLAGDRRVLAVDATSADGETRTFKANYFFSTMPARELIAAFERGGSAVPTNVSQVADGLIYRDFIIVGILANKLSIAEPDGSLLKDTWIYVHDPGVRAGRVQIFNNWSPDLAVPGKVWLGVEYFCSESDRLWKMSDEDLKKLAAMELEKIGILETKDVTDAHVERAPKAYPAYSGTYGRFAELRAYTDSFENLFLIGRNGMHKYNNQDHSMLTAIEAVENVLRGITAKDNLWSVNTEQDYHEERT